MEECIIGLVCIFPPIWNNQVAIQQRDGPCPDAKAQLREAQRRNTAETHIKTMEKLNNAGAPLFCMVCLSYITARHLLLFPLSPVLFQLLSCPVQGDPSFAYG